MAKKMKTDKVSVGNSNPGNMQSNRRLGADPSEKESGKTGTPPKPFLIGNVQSSILHNAIVAVERSDDPISA